MGTNKKYDDLVDAVLQDAYGGIEPPDSWEALRARIDRRMDSVPSIPAAQLSRSVVFWRRVAFAMAACFLISVGLLIYMVGVSHGTRGHWRRHGVPNQGLFSQAQLNQLSKTFSNVRELFGQQLPWIIVGSGNDAEIGVAQIVPAADMPKVVIVRLALSLEKQTAKQQYFDIVTFSNQQAKFRLPLIGTSPIDVSLKPTLKNDGAVMVEINAQFNGSSEAKSTATVVDDTFTSLVRLRAKDDWVNIAGIGRSMSNI